MTETQAERHPQGMRGRRTDPREQERRVVALAQAVETARLSEGNTTADVVLASAEKFYAFLSGDE